MCLKEMSIMDQKKEICLLWKSQTYSITELARQYSVSRPTIYRYIHRFLENGFEGLEEHSRAPQHIPNQTPQEIEDRIIKLRKKKAYRRFGPKKLAVLLLDYFEADQIPSGPTIYRILHKHNLVKPQKHRKRTEPKHPVFDPVEANETWSADHKGKFRLLSGVYCYPLTISDSCTRMILAAEALPTTKEVDAKPVFIKVFRKYGLPLQIHTDNGAPFGCINSLGRLSKLSVWFMELGIQQVFSDPAHPEQNGRHERMHRELKAEATRPPGRDFKAQQRLLNKFVKIYNEKRPHESLGMKTPNEIHSFSPRKYPRKIKAWYYPSHFIVRRVCRNGAIRIGKKNWLFLTSTLCEKKVGLEEIGNKIYRLYFREFFLAYVDMKDLKVYDIMTYKNELHL